MDLINLTPHNVNVIDDNGNCVLTIQPTVPPARCNEHFIEDDYPLYVLKDKTKVNLGTGDLSYHNVTGLPPIKTATYYVVSVLVAQQYPGRDDLLVPYDLVRREGQIIGCKRLVRIA
jgi:hypothetical protein